MMCTRHARADLRSSRDILQVGCPEELILGEFDCTIGDIVCGLDCHVDDSPDILALLRPNTLHNPCELMVNDLLESGSWRPKYTTYT